MNIKSRVLKYGTGDTVPPQAVYITTVVEIDHAGRRFVWHYFQVED